MIRGYSKNQVIGMNFPREQYTFPTGNGNFNGTLAMKMWSDKQGLICYFDTDNNEKFKLCVWFSNNDDKSYRPKQSTVDISYLEIGTKCIITYENKNGKTVWLDVDVSSKQKELQKEHYPCPIDCLTCSNSQSEEAVNEGEDDKLYCVLKEEYVNETDYCDDYN